MDKLKPISYHKWDKHDINKLYNSMRNILQVEQPQLYYPIMSLFFYIHNTSWSHKVIDYKRHNYIKQVLHYDKDNRFSSNISLTATTYDNTLFTEKTEELFAKVISILDPIHFILNNYNTSIPRNPYLPSNYSFNTYSKINDMNNSAYIDVFCSFIMSNLTLEDINPSFPKYYGSVNGINDVRYDISEEYHDFKNHDGFKKLLGKRFTIDVYEKEPDSDSSDDSHSSHNSNNSSNSSYSSNSSNSSYSSSGNYDCNDYIVNLKHVPVIYLFIEKLKGTLEDIIQDDLSIELLKSCLFQVAFALSYVQKHYKFTHNDLHINNVMYCETNKPFLYYKLNNIYFKVPTYGKLFKIIDFGRSIFTYGKKTYMNDAFSKYGEAEGQYTYPQQVSFIDNKEDKETIEPSYYFDLCRLAITMLDEIRYNYDDKLEDNDDYQGFLDFLKFISTDKHDQRLDKVDDNFNLYIRISKDARNSLPKDILTNDFFNEYKVSKKKFPKKIYYDLN